MINLESIFKQFESQEKSICLKDFNYQDSSVAPNPSTNVQIQGSDKVYWEFKRGT